jgi:hypothetical protein
MLMTKNSLIALIATALLTSAAGCVGGELPQEEVVETTYQAKVDIGWKAVASNAANDGITAGVAETTVKHTNDYQPFAEDALRIQASVGDDRGCTYMLSVVLGRSPKNTDYFEILPGLEDNETFTGTQMTVPIQDVNAIVMYRELCEDSKRAWRARDGWVSVTQAADGGVTLRLDDVPFGKDATFGLEMDPALLGDNDAEGRFIADGAIELFAAE